jgi:hypothetical protein
VLKNTWTMSLDAESLARRGYLYHSAAIIEDEELSTDDAFENSRQPSKKYKTTI